MSRKLEEVKRDLYGRILEAINLAIEEKVLPTIRNALNCIMLILAKIRTFGQMDRIRTKFAKWLRNVTLGRVDPIKA